MIPGSTATILVESSLSGGSASLSDKPVVFDGAGWPEMQLTGNSMDGELNADYCMEFDLLIPSATLSGTTGIFTALINSPSHTIANITLQTTNMRAILISNQGGAGSLETQVGTFNNAWQTDKVMHVALQLNTATDKVEAYIDGGKIGDVLIAPTATSGYRNVRTLKVMAGGNGDDPFGGRQYRGFGQPGSRAGDDGAVADRCGGSGQASLNVVDRAIESLRQPVFLLFATEQ